MSAFPVNKPIIISRPRPDLRIEQGVRPAVTSRVISRAAVFGALSLSFFFSSSLAGQVMVEKARLDGLHAVQRAKDAVKEESLLRDRVQAMTRNSSITDWALDNGFVPPESLASVQSASAAKNVH